MQQLIVNSLITSSIYLIVSFGFYLHYRFFKFFNFALAGYITISAYTLYLFVNIFKQSIFVAIPLSIILSLIFILPFELIIFKLQNKLRLASTFLLVVSIGLYLIIENLVTLFFNNEAKIIGNFKPKFLFNNDFFTLTIIQGLFIIFAFLIAFYFITNNSVFFKKLKATISNKELSENNGINYFEVSFKVIFLYLLLFIASGFLIGLDKSIIPSMGFSYLLFGIIATIIGGLKLGFKHLIYGVLFLAFVQNFIAFYVGYKWLNGVSFVLLIGFLLFKPFGFSNYKIKKTDI